MRDHFSDFLTGLVWLSWVFLLVTSVTSIALKRKCFSGYSIESATRHNPIQRIYVRPGRRFLSMYQPAFAKYFADRRSGSQPSHPARYASWHLWAIALALLFFPGCNALNPLCGSSRPSPVIASLSAPSITLAQAQQGFVLTVNGKQFVSSSVVSINGTTLSTTVVSSQELQVTIPTNLISSPGTASVTVNTPSGNSGNLGCSSGGTSSALTLTIT
jgi:hypothetical protein